MRDLKSVSLLGIILIGVVSLFVTFPVIPVTGEVPWKDQGPEWYYDNLNAMDRKKIRQAIDYCIHRKQIIDNFHSGYATAIASPIGMNFRGVYEPSIAAREYNTTKAKELLMEVFGYEYSTSTDGTNETSKVTNVPYFNLALIYPSSSSVWRDYFRSWVSNPLREVGIHVKVGRWNWNIFMPRIFLTPAGTGYDYEHGGYDGFYLGYDASPDPKYKEYYDKNCFPPSGNCYWIEDGPPTSGKWTPEAYPNITALWTAIYKEMDPNTRVTMLKEYQQWCYDNIPTVIIQQSKLPWAIDANLKGIDLFHGIQQQICNWTEIGTDVTIAISGWQDIDDFNPLLSNNYNNKLIYSNTHVSLARRRGEYNLSHTYPWLAESWITDDYLTWIVNLRKNNYWSDGEPITADDVVFTYQTVLNASTGAPSESILANILVNETDSNGKFRAVKKGTNDYEVIFTLSDVYTYTETVLFSLNILPEHQMSQIDLTNWKNDGTNTGNIPIVASGPYVLNNYDNTDTIELWANPHYNATTMGHSPSAIGGGNWIPNPTSPGHITNISFEVVKSENTAVTSLLAGTYDVLDSRIWINYEAQIINNSANYTVLTGYEWGHQEIGLNHYSPIWGMNPHDPRDMYPPEPFNLFLEINLLIPNPIVFLGLFSTLFCAGGFMAWIVENFKKRWKINSED